MSVMVTDVEDFEDLLASAEANASSDWEMGFVEDLSERYERYGDDMFLSEKQAEILRRIANGE